MKDLLQLAGGRKFIACMSALIAATAVLYSDLITGLIYRDIVLGTIGVFVAGNVAQKALVKKADA